MFKDTIRTLDLKEVISSFLKGKINDDDLFMEGSRALEQKLVSIKDLVPLLKSENKFAQLAAVYIAASESDNSCEIFDYIKPLLTSQYWEVREEVCDCFICCASNKELRLLLDLLEDNEEIIRVKILHVFLSIGYKRLLSFLKYLSLDYPYIAIILKLIDSLEKNGCNISNSLSELNTDDNVSSCFLYILGIYAFSDVEKLDQLAKFIRTKNVNRFHEIYFVKDPADDSCIPWRITSFTKNS